jgi:type I restriction enzyme S subunit
MESPIPLPPLQEQQRIATILDKADVIRRKRAETLYLADDFLKSAFLDLVGLRHAEFVDEGIAVLGIDNAVNNRFEWAQRRFITEEKYEELEQYTVFPGDVIITIMGTTGRTAVVPEDIPTAISTKHLATITLERTLVHPQFIAFSVRENPDVLHQIAMASKGAIMDGLNLTIIKELRLRVPPLEIQEQFEMLVMRAEKTRGHLLRLQEEADKLFNSLVHRAFRGEL